MARTDLRPAPLTSCLLPGTLVIRSRYSTSHLAMNHSNDGTEFRLLFRKTAHCLWYRCVRGMCPYVPGWISRLFRNITVEHLAPCASVYVTPLGSTHAYACGGIMHYLLPLSHPLMHICSGRESRKTQHST